MPPDTMFVIQVLAAALIVLLPIIFFRHRRWQQSEREYREQCERLQIYRSLPPEEQWKENQRQFAEKIAKQREEVERELDEILGQDLASQNANQS